MIHRIWNWLRGNDIWPNSWSVVTVATPHGLVVGETIVIRDESARVWWVDRHKLTVS